MEQGAVEQQDNLSQWLQDRCKKEHLSLREAAARTGLSHATIRDIMNTGHAFPESIKKLAQGFGGDGSLALENYLFELVGYRTPHEFSEPLAQLIDKARQLNDPQLKMMVSFADFLIEIEAGSDET